MKIAVIFSEKYYLLFLLCTKFPHLSFLKRDIKGSSNLWLILVGHKTKWADMNLWDRFVGLFPEVGIQEVGVASIQNVCRWNCKKKNVLIKDENYESNTFFWLTVSHVQKGFCVKELRHILAIIRSLAHWQIRLHEKCLFLDGRWIIYNSN